MTLSLRGGNKTLYKIKKNYRPIFLHLFKEIASKSALFDKLYAEKEFSPFASSVYFGNNFKVLKDGFQFSSPIQLFFSTGQFALYAHFINGCLDFKNNSETIKIDKETEMFVEDIFPIQPEKVSSHEISIKTMSPIVVQNPDASKEDFNNFYLTPNDSYFQEIINIITQKRMHHHETDGFTPITIKTVKSRDEYVYHYGGYVKSSSGIFNLKASKETLQFLYDYGIGNRTGQLFGLFKMHSRR